MAQQLNNSRTMFHIGAVARMTGLSPDIIRAWERRYGVVAPNRTPTKHRLYSREDIARLALIKTLVDAGDRIGAVGALSLDELQHRLNTHKRQETSKIKPVRRSVQRIAVLGDVLPVHLERHRAIFAGLVDFVLMSRNRVDFEAEVQTARPHLIVLEYPTVHDETTEEIRDLLDKSGAARALVVYGFGSQRAIRKLDTRRITPLRAPVDMPELKHLIVAASADVEWHTTPEEQSGKWGDPNYVPLRRYSDEALLSIALAANPVRCECPHHLVDLIRSLSAFETYSIECEQRDAADAALHAFLHATAAQARLLLEVALTRIAEEENIAVTQAQTARRSPDAIR